MTRMAVSVAGLLALSACSGTGEERARGEAETGGLGRVEGIAAAACARERASAPLDPDATPTECRSDADCTAGQNGRCLRLSNRGSHGPRHEATFCSYDACFSDADCGPREMCACAERAPSEPGRGHACVAGECDVDADCGEGRYCRRTESGRHCHSPRDECVEETDCGEGRRCSRAADGLYRCAPVGPPPVG